jgi:hypothetical protein
MARLRGAGAKTYGNNSYGFRHLIVGMVRTNSLLKIAGVVLLVFVALAVLSTLVSFAIWLVEITITLAAIAVLIYLAYLLFGYLSGGGGSGGSRSRSRSRERDRIFER